MYDHETTVKRWAALLDASFKAGLTSASLTKRAPSGVAQGPGRSIQEADWTFTGGELAAAAERET